MSDVICVSILRFFGDLTDPRQMAKVLYPLPEIILVALCSAICGADSFVEMAEFGRAKLDFLRKILPLKNGIPSHDTFGAVFANLDARQFNDIFVKWILSLQKIIPKLVAIDGKTVRGSKNGDIPLFMLFQHGHLTRDWFWAKSKQKRNPMKLQPYQNCCLCYP